MGNWGLVSENSSFNVRKRVCSQIVESSKCQFDKCGLYFILTGEPLEILRWSIFMIIVITVHWVPKTYSTLFFKYTNQMYFLPWQLLFWMLQLILPKKKKIVWEHNEFRSSRVNTISYSIHSLILIWVPLSCCIMFFEEYKKVKGIWLS